MKNKYALIKLNGNSYEHNDEINNALKVLKSAGLLIENQKNSKDEFFVIMLKDENSDKAISAYGVSCSVKNPELLEFVKDKLSRAGRYSIFCKSPD